MPAEGTPAEGFFRRPAAGTPAERFRGPAERKPAEGKPDRRFAPHTGDGVAFTNRLAWFWCTYN